VFPLLAASSVGANFPSSPLLFFRLRNLAAIWPTPPMRRAPFPATRFMSALVTEIAFCSWRFLSFPRLDQAPQIVSPRSRHCKFFFERRVSSSVSFAPPETFPSFVYRPSFFPLGRVQVPMTPSFFPDFGILRPSSGDPVQITSCFFLIRDQGLPFIFSLLPFTFSQTLFGPFSFLTLYLSFTIIGAW